MNINISILFVALNMSVSVRETELKKESERKSMCVCGGERGNVGMIEMMGERKNKKRKREIVCVRQRVCERHSLIEREFDRECER